MKRSRGNRFAEVFYSLRTVLIVIVICIVAFAAVVFIAYRLLAWSGSRRFRNETDSKGPNLVMEVSGDESDEGDPDAEKGPEKVWKEGWIRYNGKVYEYKEGIINILLLGIDKNKEVSGNKDLTDGGQSDAIFLVAADTEEKSISIIGVNRDTIVDVVMVGIGENGEDIVWPAQITVQHGFGDGKEGSCELTKARVSEVFYDLPIHAYASFNMGGLPELNDALGGVELTIPVDMTYENEKWTEGTKVTLKGNDAEAFVRARNCNVFESARIRLENQKLYVKALMAKGVAATKADVTTPLRLYNRFKKYIVTDLTVDELVYLAGEFAGYRFDPEIRSLQGTTVKGEQFEEFTPDEQALKDLIVEIFYREVPETELTAQ